MVVICSLYSASVNGAAVVVSGAVVVTSAPAVVPSALGLPPHPTTATYNISAVIVTATLFFINFFIISSCFAFNVMPRYYII